MWGAGPPLPDVAALAVELFPETAAFPAAVVPVAVAPVAAPQGAVAAEIPVATDSPDEWIRADHPLDGYDDGWEWPTPRVGAPIPVPHGRRGARVLAVLGAAALIVASGAGATLFLRSGTESTDPEVPLARTAATAPPRIAPAVTLASTTTTTTAPEAAPEPAPTAVTAPRRAAPAVVPRPVVADPPPTDEPTAPPTDEPTAPTSTTTSSTTTTSTTTTTTPADPP